LEEEEEEVFVDDEEKEAIVDEEVEEAFANEEEEQALVDEENDKVFEVHSMMLNELSTNNIKKICIISFKQFYHQKWEQNHFQNTYQNLTT
jgi:hypothetical protein